MLPGDSHSMDLLIAEPAKIFSAGTRSQKEACPHYALCMMRAGFYTALF